VLCHLVINVNNQRLVCYIIQNFGSRRDRMKVAWHVVPGDRATIVLSRRVRYDPVVGAGTVSTIEVTGPRRTPHTVPYGTDRIGRSLPGTTRQATFIRSLRDNRRSEYRAPVLAAAYLIAPIVNPRTNCRETMMLNMMTGRAIMVPVAMICPQGKS